MPWPRVSKVCSIDEDYGIAPVCDRSRNASGAPGNSAEMPGLKIEPGTKLLDRFIVKEKVGAGGFGQIYR